MLKAAIDQCWGAEQSYCTTAVIPVSENSATLTQRTGLTGFFPLVGLDFNSTFTVGNDSHWSLFGFLLHVVQDILW